MSTVLARPHFRMPTSIALAMGALLVGASGASAQPSVAASSDTVRLTEWTVPWEKTQPRDPAVDASGRVWFVGQTGNYVARLDASTGGFTRIEIDSGTFPHTVSIDSKGNAWYTGNRNGMIGRIDGRTGVITRYPMPDPAARDPHTIAYVQCPDETDEHYDALKKMESELNGFRQANGQPYRLVPLPWPDACFDDDGHRLPATYANFLFINGAVLVPLYGVRQDDKALDVFRTLFPQHEIIGINCRPLILQHGSLHCVTMNYLAGVITSL